MKGGFSWNKKTKRAWCEVIVPGTKSKQRLRRVIKADTEKLAYERFRTWRDAVLIAKGEPEVWTLRIYVARFWPLMKARYAPKGAQAVEEALTNRILPFIGDLPLSQITAPTLKDLKSQLINVGWKRKGAPEGEAPRPYAPGSINNAVATVKMLLRDAVGRELLAHYPVKAKVPREIEPVLAQELKPEEKTAFLDAFDDEVGFRRKFKADATLTTPEQIHAAAEVYFARFRAMRPVFVLALQTGLRRGDLLALKWSDVDLKAKRIRVVMQKTKVVAVIPISRTCRAALDVFRARTSSIGGTVVVSEEGKPIAVMTLIRYFRLAKQLAGITRRFRLHDTRHSFACDLLTAGESMQVVQKALGHKSVVTTMKNYGRVADSAIDKAGDRLDEVEAARTLRANTLPAAVAVAATGSPYHGAGKDGGPCPTRTDDSLLKSKSSESGKPGIEGSEQPGSSEDDPDPSPGSPRATPANTSANTRRGGR